MGLYTSLPLQVLCSCEHYVGAFLFFALPFAACYAGSRWLLTWKAVDGPSGEVLELGGTYVRVTFWFQFVLLLIWLPTALSCEPGFCGCSVQGWLVRVTAYPLVLGKGLALFHHQRGLERAGGAGGEVL